MQPRQFIANFVGAVVALPLAAHAQQLATAAIGFFNARRKLPCASSFRDRLFIARILQDCTYRYRLNNSDRRE
jgi:hypothetical protein